MHPVIFRIEHLTIYSYGLMVSMGFLLAAFLSIRTARKEGFNPNLIMDAALWILLGGITGARLLYVLLNLDYYTRNPFEIIMLNRGGLVFYGGLITGIAAGVWFLKRKMMSVGPIADIIIPYLPLGHAIGRIGCYLNGCCYGKVALHGSGVIFPLGSIAGDAHPYQPLIPIQIYSALTLIRIFLLLKFFRVRRLFPGSILFVYGILYSLDRFILEFFRGDNPVFLWRLTVFQVISIIIFLTCATFLLWKSVISRSRLKIQAKG